MEDRSNKTIISSVLFLDIVEYSKKPVTGQISLKDRFNTYLSEAIYDVPVTDRIILDTGDGAAVNFLGDVESALKAALRLRTSLLSEDPYLEPQLLVRIGINLGPVRLVRDINGQPNIVGDGINVAQRVMAFADASQILVSRSYYDAVSRLSAQYTGMFHYQGSRTDKHVREHEIYAIGYPGDQTTKKMSIQESKSPQRYVQVLGHARSVLFSSVSKPGVWSEKIQQASAKQRALYAGMVVVPLLLLAGILVFLPAHREAPQTKLPVETMPPASAVPAISTAMEQVAQKNAVTDKVAADKVAADKVAADKVAADKVAADKVAADKVAADKKASAMAVSAKAASNKRISETPSAQAAAQEKHKVEQVVKKAAASAKNSENLSQNRTSDAAAAGEFAHILVACKEGTQVFVDGSQKGKMSLDSMVVTIKPGKHKVILTHPSFGIYSEEVDVDPSKTERVKPKVCN